MIVELWSFLLLSKVFLRDCLRYTFRDSSGHFTNKSCMDSFKNSIRNSSTDSFQNCSFYLVCFFQELLWWMLQIFIKFFFPKKSFRNFSRNSSKIPMLIPSCFFFSKSFQKILQEFSAEIAFEIPPGNPFQVEFFLWFQIKFLFSKFFTGFFFENSFWFLRIFLN